MSPYREPGERPEVPRVAAPFDARPPMLWLLAAFLLLMYFAGVAVGLLVARTCAPPPPVATLRGDVTGVPHTGPEPMTTVTARAPDLPHVWVIDCAGHTGMACSDVAESCIVLEGPGNPCERVGYGEHEHLVRLGNPWGSPWPY